jgi:hypothetical protein
MAHGTRKLSALGEKRSALVSCYHLHDLPLLSAKCKGFLNGGVLTAWLQLNVAPFVLHELFHEKDKGQFFRLFTLATELITELSLGQHQIA